MSLVHSVLNVERPSLKVNPVKPSEGNSNSTLSVILNNVICLEDVGSYLNSKCETISSHLLSKDMNIIFNQDMSVKPEFEHLRNSDLVKYHFYKDLDVDEWTQIILSGVYDWKIWMGENVIDISTNLIHEVTRLSK
jgi:hypothetical protein